MKKLREQLNELYTAEIVNFDVHTAMKAIQVAKQMDALLEECVGALQHVVMSSSASPSDAETVERFLTSLVEAGYDNDTDR